MLYVFNVVMEENDAWFIMLLDDIEYWRNYEILLFEISCDVWIYEYTVLWNENVKFM